MIVDQEQINSLVSQAQSGDKEAFHDLHQIYWRQIRYFIWKTLKNESEVEDVLQETFIEAYRHLTNLKDPTVFRAWLYKIALFQCNRVFRKKRPLIFSDLDENVVSAIPDETAEFLPVSVLENKEAGALILRLVEQLPDEQRVTLMLFYFQQMTIVEIARVMDCPENTVKSRMRYAKRALRTQIEKEQQKGTLLYSSALLLLYFTFYLNP
jgi:RNA polymerase sigma factor (sigma-70 family)